MKQHLAKLYTVAVTVLAVLLAVRLMTLQPAVPSDNSDPVKPMDFDSINTLEVTPGVEQAQLQASENKDWALMSWISSLSQMGYDADVAFLGDSLTRGGNWQKAFPGKSVINLGISGDGLEDLIERHEMVHLVQPEQVFVMGGVNGFIPDRMDQIMQSYDTLLTSLEETVPEADIYVQNMLPVTDGRLQYADNQDILVFNQELEALAAEHGLTYIDLHSQFVKDGQMDPALTSDGLHLTNEGYRRWYAAIAPYVTGE